MAGQAAGAASSGSTGEGIYAPFLFTFEAGELEDYICIANREMPCKQHESCLLCAAIRDGQGILAKRKTARKTAESVRALLDDTQFRIGWDFTDPVTWSTNFVWTINTCVKLRKELSHCGAVEINKEAIKAAVNTSGLKKFVVEASWTRGAPPADVKELKAYWRALTFIVWKDMGNTHYASWIQHTMPEPCQGFTQEEKLGDMVEALLGFRWLLHLNLKEHPLREGRKLVGEGVWEEWLTNSVASWVPSEELATTTFGAAIFGMGSSGDKAGEQAEEAAQQEAAGSAESGSEETELALGKVQRPRRRQEGRRRFSRTSGRRTRARLLDEVQELGKQVSDNNQRIKALENSVVKQFAQMGEQVSRAFEQARLAQGKAFEAAQKHQDVRFAQIVTKLEPIASIEEIKNRLEHSMDVVQLEEEGSCSGEMYEQAWDQGLIDFWVPLDKGDVDTEFLVATFASALYQGNAWNDLKALSRGLVKGRRQSGTVQRAEAVARQWLRHGKPSPPTHIALGWVPLGDVLDRVSNAMKAEIKVEELMEALLMSTDHGSQGGRISVFQIRGFTAQEMMTMSPKPAALGIGAETSFLWIRANPAAGSTPHAMDPWGVVKGVQEEKIESKSSWSSSKDNQWKGTSSSGWRS